MKKRIDFVDRLSHGLFLVILLGTLHIGVTNGEKFKWWNNMYGGNEIQLTLGDYNDPLNAQHFKLSYTVDGGPKKFIEFLLDSSVNTSFSEITLRTGSSISSCRQSCIVASNCNLMLSKSGEGCKFYTVNVTRPAGFPYSVAPELTKYTVYRTNQFGIVQTRIFLRVAFDITYRFSFHVPYDNATSSITKEVTLKQPSIENSYFNAYCKKAEIVSEPVICTISTNFIFSAATGIINSVNTIQISHSDPALVVSEPRQMILDARNGTVHIIEKFYLTSAGAYTVTFKAKKKNQVNYLGEIEFFTKTMTVSDYGIHYYLQNWNQLNQYQILGTMLNFTTCLSNTVSEPLNILYGDETANSTIARLTEFTRQTVSYMYNYNLLVNSARSSSASSVPNEENKEYFLMNTLTPYSNQKYAFKEIRVYAMTAGTIQLNFNVFLKCNSLDACEARLTNSAIDKGLDEFATYYRMFVNITSGYNVINVSTSTIKITTVQYSIMSWVSYGGMIGRAWGTWQVSDIVLDKNNTNVTYYSLWNNHTGLRLESQKTHFLVQPMVENFVSTYCFKSNHTYPTGSTYPVKAYVNNQTPRTMITLKFLIVKLFCPSSVDRYRNFSCEIRMYPPVLAGHTNHNVTVTAAAVPPVTVNSLFNSNSHTVNMSIWSTGYRTLTAYEKNYGSTFPTTVFVNDRALIEIECSPTIEQHVVFFCNITMLLDPPYGYNAHDIRVIIGTSPAIIFNKNLTTNSMQITSRIDKHGSYSMTVRESNYNNAQMSRTLAVQQRTLIVIECSPTIEQHVVFFCNITLTLSPPTGSSNHEITVTIGTSPTIIFNNNPSADSMQITSRIDTEGNYPVTVRESNYNAQIITNIIVEEKTLIILECSENIQAYDEFNCNITLTLSPPAGIANHEITVTIDTTPPTVINKVFNTNTAQISTAIDINGTYTATVSERNYNAQIVRNITVAEKILIQLNCPQTIYALERFKCNVIMLQNPATGQSTHEVKVTIATSPAIILNEIFSTNTKEISAIINNNGTYSVIVYEKNYNTFIRTSITVKEKLMIELSCNTTTQAFDEFHCNITMLIPPAPGLTNHNVTVRINTSPAEIMNLIFGTNTTQIQSMIKTVGVYTVSACEHHIGHNISREINITKVVGFSFGETRHIVGAIFNNPNSTGGDPIADLGDSNPQLLLNILALPGQDMGGCLSNCSNRGKCAMNDQNKFVCECQQYYRGSMCEIDIRGCTPKPCQNNGTCTEVILSGRDNGFTCNCSSPVYFGIRCEQKVNVCWNKTCNHNGKCFDNSTIPTCKCFKYFSGEDCEIKSEELKAMKQTATLASAAAVTIVSGFYVSIFAMDYIKFVHAAVMALFA